MAAFNIPRSFEELGGTLPSVALPAEAVQTSGDQSMVKLDIVGAAAGAGGDRTSIQTDAGVDIRRYDANGTAHHYIGAASNPSNLYHQFHPLNTDAARPGVTFTINGSSHLNMGGTTYNNVMGLGWNDNGGVPLVPGQKLMRDGFEDNWESALEVFQAERHIAATYDPDTGQEIRPITISVVTSSAPMTSQVSFESSYLNQVVEVDRTSLMSSIKSGNDYNFFTLAFSAYQNVPLALNQTSFGNNGLDSSLKVNGRTGRLTFQLNGVNKWAFVSHSDNNLYINNASDVNAITINQGLEARFGGTVFAAPGGNGQITAVRMANTSATGGAGDYSWQVGGPTSGRDGELRLFHGPTSKVLARFNSTGFAFHDSAPVAKPAVTGSRGGNAALASLITALASLGLITDSSTS